MDRALQGDKDAYGVLYDRYVDAVYRFVYFRVNSVRDAEDLTEMVFLKTYETVRSRKRKIDNFPAWLFRAARNLVIDHYRTRKNHTPLEQVESLPGQQASVDSALLASEERTRLQQAMNKLDPILQQVLAYRFISNLSYAQTAEVMQLREDHLRVLQFRALKKLRQEYAPDHE
jgi:RNA polymerase sigma-70 factor (ECF subfamily)